MKTKISTLIAIFALGIIGFTNINATEDNKKAANEEAATMNSEMLTSRSSLADEAFIKSAEALTAKEADAQIDKYASRQIQLEGNAAGHSDFMSSAESFTASGANSEIEKYATKQVQLEGIATANSDFLSSAESYTASGANCEIEKYAEKQISRMGK